MVVVSTEGILLGVLSNLSLIIKLSMVPHNNVFNNTDVTIVSAV